MGDVGEGAAMHEGRIVLQRLHQVRLHRIFQEHRHGAVRFQVARMHRRPVETIADDDVAEPPLQIFEIGGEAEDRHYLGGDGDVEPALARETVGDAAERGDHASERPVVHVHHPPPGDAADVDILFVAPVDVVVDHRRQQIVRGGDRMEIAGEMQVDVFHRHDLRITAAGRAALDAEARTERGLADADNGFLADPVQPIAEPDGGRRLALARRRRIDRSDEDQLAILLARLRGDELGADLRLVVTIGNELLDRNAEFRPDFEDRLLAAARAISISDLIDGMDVPRPTPAGAEPLFFSSSR